MTSIGTTTSWSRRAPAGALRALWSPSSWRATLLAVAGIPLGVGNFSLIGLLVLLWGSAVWSLVTVPTGAWYLPGSYVAMALAGPVLLPWLVRGCGEVQRARFRELFGVELAGPSRGSGAWLTRLLRPWWSARTWRQLGYHLLAVVVGGAGGGLVAACWLALPVSLGFAGVLRGDAGWGPGAAVATILVAAALLLAAPWVARAVAQADVVLGRALLGPGRAEELTLRVESLARSRAEIVAATDAERRRIERDLHDGAQQRLVSLAMHLGMARATLTDASEPARKAIAEAHDEALQALAELREFVRGLHPAVLNDRGLDAALSGIAARAPLPVRLRVEVATRCSPSVEAVAYFVVSEALTNVAKHAHASSCEVTVRRGGDLLRIVVSDDGVGGASEDRGGSGLRGLAQRAAAVDGTMEVDSPAGGPTRITVELPCES